MDESLDPVAPETPTKQTGKKAKQPAWELTDARMDNLARAREKAAALRREIRDANGPKAAKVVKATKLELELENIRLKKQEPVVTKEPVATKEPVKEEPIVKEEPVVVKEIVHEPAIRKIGEFYFV